MKVEFVEAAESELADAVTYFDAQRAGLGQVFAAAVDRIAEYPDAWQSLHGGVRRCLLQKFEYGLVYRVRDDTATIYAVMHLRRRPRYWRRRLSE